MGRPESLTLEPVAELKHQRSSTPAAPKKRTPKTNDETDADYVSTRPNQQGEGFHQVLTANVNGVNYKSEM